MDTAFVSNPCKGNGSTPPPLMTPQQGADRSAGMAVAERQESRLQQRKGLCMLAPLAVPDRIDDVRLSRIDGVCPAAVIRNDGLNKPLLLTEGSPSRLSTPRVRRRETSDALQ